VAGGRKEGRERQVCDGVEMRMPYPRLGYDDAEKNQRNNKRKENKEKARGDEQQRKKKKKTILMFDARITLLIFIFYARINLLIFVSCSMSNTKETKET
jgi:hypothetical protein